MHNIIIPRYANLTCSELGFDNPEYPGAKRGFYNHQPVHYQFNAQGFRTHDLDKFDSNSILVVGDSFTLGLGENVDSCYPALIEQQLGCPVFNVSLNGASNDWIARRVGDLLKITSPRAIVIHYTFSHRREYHDITWFDDERTLSEPDHTSQENYDNWQTNFNKIVNLAGTIPLIHSFIPNWHDAQVDYYNIPGIVLKPVARLDFARDGFHYGVKTHQRLAGQLTNLLVDELRQSHAP